MPDTIVINKLAISHKGSNGVSTATLPDVCKTPTPGGPVPMPYPNVSMSSSLANGTTTVKVDGGNMAAIKGSEYSTSVGDEPGTVGGVASNTFKKESTWITYSFDVKMDGGNVCRLTDKKFQNHKNTVDLAGDVEVGGGLCALAGEMAKVAEEKLPASVKKKPHVVAGANFSSSNNNVQSGPALSVSGGVLSSKQILPGGKYQGFSKGVKRSKGQSESNVPCPPAPRHVYKDVGPNGRPKEGHAEARILETLFKTAKPGLPSGTLALKVVGQPICDDCKEIIKCAEKSGLKIVICP